MAGVAFDRCVRAVEAQALDGPVEHWREIRDKIHREVCERGYDKDLQSFTQSYGSKELDASLLLIPLVGFLPASDPRVRGTVEAVERELLRDGLVLRYRTHEAGVDGGVVHAARGARRVARPLDGLPDGAGLASTERLRERVERAGGLRRRGSVGAEHAEGTGRHRAGIGDRGVQRGGERPERIEA